MLFSELEAPALGILGAGREGQAVWRQLRARFPGKRITVFSEGEVDTDFEVELAASGDRLRKGTLRAASLAGCEVLVRSPGISPYREELRAARSRGVRFTSASNIWFAENPQAHTLCITGTKGKSTTTALTAHLLRAAGHRVNMAGNIGQTMLEQGSADWWVIELSSYQLCDLHARPTAAAILNLTEEHLDWHVGRDSYRQDKLRLAGMVGADALAADFEDAVLREALASHPGVRWFNLSEGWHVTGGRVQTAASSSGGYALPLLPGRHNLCNLAAALTLCEMIAGLPADVQGALDAFAGLPHRLHSIGQAGGLRFVDDSLSTTPQAVLAALTALKGEQVIVLLGGMDRGLDWGGVVDRFREVMPFAMIAMPDNGPHILSEFAGQGLEAEGGMHQAGDLQSAVRLAREITPQGGVVLLSPGAPSFPHFADYRERGLDFAKAAGL